MPLTQTTRSALHRRARRLLVFCAPILIVWFAIACHLDTYFSHGWSAQWLTRIDNERVNIVETTEHRAVFPNSHRALARYVQGWPFERLGVPVDLPMVDAHLSAWIDVPGPAPRYFRARTPNAAEIRVDSAVVNRQAIVPGRHRLDVHWEGAERNRLPETLSLTVEWSSNGESWSAIPASALIPAQGSWNTSRSMLWWFAILGALGWCGLLLYAVWPNDPIRCGQRLLVIPTLLVLLIGASYRLADYQVMPDFRETADELFATWNGWSLLNEGQTRGWSLWHPLYGPLVDRETVEFFGEERVNILPYFEHPPLLHLMAGAAATLGGADHWLESKLSDTRLVPIGLSVLSIWLIILIGRRLFPDSPAPWLGGLLYASLPNLVLQTRVIKEEALLVPLMLGMIYFFLRWREHKRTRDLVAAAILAGLGVWTKIPAIVYIPALVMLVVAEKRALSKGALALLISTTLASTLLIYAAYFDWHVFWFTQARQSTRPTHWNLFPRFFDCVLINDKFLGRGWLLFLWISAAGTFFRNRSKDMAPLTVPLVTYLCAIAVGAGNWMYGWYALPIFALLCIGSGAFLADLWKRPNLLGGLIFVVLLIFYSLNFTLDVDWAKDPSAWRGLRRTVTLTATAFLAPYALVQVWSDNHHLKRLARFSFAVSLAVFIALSGVFATHYDEYAETYQNFDQDDWFHR